MACRKHIWQPLFTAPAADASEELHIAFYGLRLKGRASYTVCTSCGTIGSTRRGYSRGGVHATKPTYHDEETLARLRDEAKAWAGRLQT